jgi:hypothetical protein
MVEMGHVRGARGRDGRSDIYDNFECMHGVGWRSVFIFEN